MVRLVKAARELDALGLPPPPPAEEARLRGRLHSRTATQASVSLPLRRRQRLLRDGPRAELDLLVRLLADRGHARSSRPRRPSTSSSAASSASSPACGCSTSAAAGDPWRSTPPGGTASRWSASRSPRSSSEGRRTGRRGRPGATRSRSACRTTGRSPTVRSTRSAASACSSTSAWSARGVPRRPAHLLVPGGRLLNHAISRPEPSSRPSVSARSFIGRYVFPDAALLEVGTVVSAMQDEGLEVRDVQSLREHYARTLRAWVGQPRGELGRSRSARRPRSGPGLASLHGRVGDRLRAAPHVDPPGAGGEHAPDRRLRHARHPRRHRRRRAPRLTWTD